MKKKCVFSVLSPLSSLASSTCYTPSFIACERRATFLCSQAHSHVPWRAMQCTSLLRGPKPPPPQHPHRGPPLCAQPRPPPLPSHPIAPELREFFQDLPIKRIEPRHVGFETRHDVIKLLQLDLGLLRLVVRSESNGLACHVEREGVEIPWWRDFMGVKEAGEARHGGVGVDVDPRVRGSCERARGRVSFAPRDQK